MRMNMHLVGLLLIFLFSFHSSHSSNRNFFLTQYKTDQGLSNNRITQIGQDKNGTIWIGTRYGLNTFDGSEFQSFVHNDFDENSISGNQIIDFTIDQNDKIWINTLENGICIYDPNTNSFTKLHDVNDDNRLAPDVTSPFLKVYADIHGNIWIGTTQSLILLKAIVGSDYQFDIIEFTEIRNAGHLVSYENERILVGTTSGLYVLNIGSKTVEKIELSKINTNDGAEYITCILPGSSGFFWVGTRGGGLFHINPSETIPVQAKFLPDNETIYSMALDSQDVIWISTANGIQIYDISQKTMVGFECYGLRSDFIHKSPSVLYASNDDYIWIGTFKEGIQLLDPFVNPFQTLDSHSSDSGSGLMSNSVVSFHESETGDLLIGTSEGYIHIFGDEGKLKRYYQLRTDEGPYPHSVYAISTSGNITISGTFRQGLINNVDHGKSFYQHRSIPGNQRRLMDNAIRSIHNGVSENWYIGTLDAGLHVFEKKTNRIKFIDPWPGSGAMKIVEDEEGFLWIAGNKGLKVIKPDNLNLSRIYQADANKKNWLRVNQINDVLVDSENEIWIGTNVGLYKYNRNTDDFTIFDEKDGLLNPLINVLVEDNEKNLWIGSENGLFRYVRNTQTFESYYKGLPERSFNPRAGIKTRNGKIYMGTMSGMVVFDPAEIKNIVSPTQTIISYFDHPSDAKKISLRYRNDRNYHITLPYNASSFSIGYSVRNFTEAPEFLYSYKLDPIHDTWVSAGKIKTAIFTKLPPGHYTFSVKASKDQKDFLAAETITIYIKPPLTQTLWFKIIALVSLIGLFILVQKIRFLGIQKRNRVLKKMVDERTAELISINDDLLKTKQDILDKNEEIQSKNDALTKQKDEISSQRNELEKQQKVLLGIQKKLDETNRLLLLLNKDLESKVELRTKELQKVNRELERFVYSASHELISPLKSIRGLLFLYQNDEKGRDQYIELVKKSIGKLEELVNNLLDFSVDHKLNLQFTKVDLWTLANEVIESLEHQNPKIKLQNEISPDFEVQSDAKRLKIALSNLVSNAIKYHDDRKDFQFIRLSALRNKEKVEITVIDNGIGMSEDTLDKIFNMYFRGSNSTAGSGLGLYITREMLLKIKADVRVESVVGKGSTFTITLPEKNTNK
jgi:signal transduction histidine kinase/ligand-binding sensor domain-containing protein